MESSVSHHHRHHDQHHPTTTTTTTTITTIPTNIHIKTSCRADNCAREAPAL